MNSEFTAVDTLTGAKVEKAHTPYRSLLRVFKLPLIAIIILSTAAATLYLSIWEKITYKKIFPGF